MTLGQWRRLGGADRDQILLGITFDTGQPEAGFAELAVHLPAYTILELVFARPDQGFGALPEPGRYFAAWAAGLGVDLAAIRGVLGHCAGAGMAGGLARHLTDRIGPVPVVAIDPSPVTAQTLYWPFVTAIEALAGQAEADELARARVAARGARDRAGEDDAGLAALAGELAARYAALVRAACARLDVPDSMAAQLSDRFDAFLAYLVTSARAQRCAAPPVAVLTSRDQPPATDAGAGGHHFDVPRTQLLDRPEVARYLAQVFGAGAATGEEVGHGND